MRQVWVVQIETKLGNYLFVDIVAADSDTASELGCFELAKLDLRPEHVLHIEAVPDGRSVH